MRQGRARKIAKSITKEICRLDTRAEGRKKKMCDCKGMEGNGGEWRGKDLVGWTDGSVDGRITGCALGCDVGCCDGCFVG